MEPGTLVVVVGCAGTAAATHRSPGVMAEVTPLHRHIGRERREGGREREGEGEGGREGEMCNGNSTIHVYIQLYMPSGLAT